ncbi:MAG: Initiation factor 2 subunit family protein [Syntrophorhabdus sp. PtaU1.Bin153]|nr:MAG: Initiation factor 2 subunit family protein [Syntrophorhabdus sp. PtaU1.Bin153]
MLRLSYSIQLKNTEAKSRLRIQPPGPAGDYPGERGETAMAEGDRDQKYYWENWVLGNLGETLQAIRENAATLITNCEEEGDIPLKDYTPHGVRHCQAVENLFHRLIPFGLYNELNELERFHLLASAWVHDLGMIRAVAIEVANDPNLSDEEIRSSHHIYSERYINEHWATLGVPYQYRRSLGLLARYHRRKADLDACERNFPCEGSSVNTQLLSAYLRLADALDIDESRVPPEAYAICLAYDISPESKLHWIKSRLAIGTRIEPERHEITVVFGLPRPEEFGKDIKQSWIDERVSPIIRFVCEDLKEEIRSVTKAIRQAGRKLPFYIDVLHDTCEAGTDPQMLNDLRELFMNFDIMVHPSASKLIEMILTTVANILGYTLKKNSQPVPLGPGAVSGIKAKETTKAFLATARLRILKTRPSHLGLERLFNSLVELNSQVGDNPKEFVSKVDIMFKEHHQARREVRAQSGAYFRQWMPKGGGLKNREFNILLFGYSELVTKALCGFRDELLIKAGKLNPRDIRGSDAEKKMSRRFRLFVCEGQPKTQTGTGDRLIYHDGMQYAFHLQRHGFRNIILIPDIVVSSMIDQVGIDFVLFGADGITPDYFMHIAGHRTITSAVRARQTLNEGLLHDRAGKRSKTDILLITSSEKWSEDKQSRPVQSTATDASQKVDGFRFWRGLSPALASREHIWICRDEARLKDLERSKVQFFNPRVDIIPIHEVDCVIADTGWRPITKGTAKQALMELFGRKAL